MIALIGKRPALFCGNVHCFASIVCKVLVGVTPLAPLCLIDRCRAALADDFGSRDADSAPCYTLLGSTCVCTVSVSTGVGEQRRNRAREPQRPHA